MALDLHSLTFGHGRQPILPTPFSCRLPNGLHFLLGRNGAGKSTLLRTIGGLLPALSGTCHFNGRPLQRLSPPERARIVSLATPMRIAAPYLTVEALLALGRAPYTGHWGRLAPSDHHIIAQYVEALNLGALLHRDLSALSDGERQQVWVARALVQDTPLVLLDEPTHHLDVVNRLQLLKRLHDIAQQEEKLILVATHEIEAALRIGNSFLVLQKGVALDHADRTTLRERDLIQAAFGAAGLRFDYEQQRFEWEAA